MANRHVVLGFLEETFGWASFSGKSTYLEPGWPQPVGNHQFLIYVEDRNQLGSLPDRFWIETYDKSAAVIPVMSMTRPATDNAESLSEGNIFVPQQGPNASNILMKIYDWFSYKLVGRLSMFGFNRRW